MSADEQPLNPPRFTGLVEDGVGRVESHEVREALLAAVQPAHSCRCFDNDRAPARFTLGLRADLGAAELRNRNDPPSFQRLTSRVPRQVLAPQSEHVDGELVTVGENKVGGVVNRRRKEGASDYPLSDLFLKLSLAPSKNGVSAYGIPPTHFLLAFPPSLR